MTKSGQTRETGEDASTCSAAGRADGTAQDEGAARRQGRQPRRDGEPRPAGAAGLHHHHRGLHGLLRQRPQAARRPRSRRSRRRWREVGKRRRRHASATPTAPLLVSVRSGARASMPGMMDTILNLGLNDETVEGPGRQVGQRALRLRQLPPLHPDVCQRRARASTTACSRTSSRTTRTSTGFTLDTDLGADDWLRDHRRLQGGGRARDRQAVPARHHRAAVGRHRRRVRLLAQRARQDLSPPARHPRQLGHGGQRAGHGVRQPRRHLGHRRRLHAQPSTGARELYGEFLLNAQGEDVVAGIRTPQPLTEAARKEAGEKATLARSADARHLSASWCRCSPRSRSTTATCRTSSSPSRTASSGCCRRAPASAPPKAALKIAVDLVAEGLIDAGRGRAAHRCRRASTSCCTPPSIPRPRSTSWRPACRPRRARPPARSCSTPTRPRR